MDIFQRCKDGNDLVAKRNIDDEMTRSDLPVLGSYGSGIERIDPKLSALDRSVFVKERNNKTKVNKSNQIKSDQIKKEKEKKSEERKYLGCRSPTLCLCILFFVNVSHVSNLALLSSPPSYSFAFSRNNIYIYIYIYKEMTVDTNRFHFHGTKRICLKLPQ